MIDTVTARALLLLPGALLISGCDADDVSTRFRLLDPDHTGIEFANTITPSDSHHFQNDAFIYNGAGVAIGDVNGDGMPDIFLSGNMVSSRLYLNRGGMRFEDVTEAAGVGTSRWATGASMADIDGDGDMDIYVSVAGPEWSDAAERANLLFLNHGEGTFTEVAQEWGIADTGFTTHAAFLDHDRDGDLDLYLLANSPGEFGRGDIGQPGLLQGSANPAGFDQLYRNDGNGRFSNISAEAGILRRLGYGLGVAVADVNRDGWPDIYVSNDIAPSDVLYVNNGDGTFTDRAGEWLDHTSFAGMGVDIADFNNDAWPDILQVDMMPESLARRKRVSGTSTHAGLESLRRRGFLPQYNLNTLQLNRGLGPDGEIIFSEVARMAGVAYTDWSWAGLFADLDNDGWKDIFITNGYPKAVTDLDYQSNSRMTSRLGDRRMAQRLGREMLDTLPGFSVPNYVFRNEGGIVFRDRSEAWHLAEAAYSYGAAYGDLDGDGRLDLVINNIDAPAFIYANAAVGDAASHYLTIRLEGEGANSRGIGAKLTLLSGGRRQYVDHSPYRGFMSTMDDAVHFGLGDHANVDSLEVVWPDGRTQLLTDLAVDRTIVIRQRDATAPGEPSGRLSDRFRFTPLDSAAGLEHQHRAAQYRVDFEVQPLLPYLPSREGPPLAVADVNGDSLDDLFIGGSPGQAGRLLVQGAGGRFVDASEAQPWAADSLQHDWGAHFFDANGDGRADLYVASGGYYLVPGSRQLQDRLYLNRGDGRFVAAPDALPQMLTSTSAVTSGDFNADGRPDLFVGGRLTPGDYPAPARSYLLRNDGGRFTDVTEELAPDLLDPGGMVTAAVWIDFDSDGALDLVTAGIWMPIRFYRNEGGRLRDVTEETGLPSMRGWWYSLALGDVDADGRTDLVAGNLGLNHSYTTSPESRFGVAAGDFSDDGTREIVFTQEIDGTEYPYHGLGLLGRDFEALQAAFPTAESFADQSMEEIFGRARLDEALRYEADTFASVWLRNEGEGRFTAAALPAVAQIAPVRSVRAEDINGDGKLDLLLVGNIHDTEANVAAADAGKGLWIRGEGSGVFTPVSPGASGFLAPNDARDLVVLNVPAGRIVVVSNHDGPLQAFLAAPAEAVTR